MGLFAGIGALVRRGFGLKQFGTPGVSAVERLLECFWVGWATTVFSLQVWHFWLPVDARVFILLGPAAAAGYLCYSHIQLILPRSVTTRTKSIYLPVLLLAAFWTANQAIGPSLSFDMGLYHLTVVDWTNAHAIVPGLANLYVRLGANSSYFLYYSLLNLGPWQGKAFHVANGVLFLALMLSIGSAAVRLLNKEADARAKVPDYFLILLLVPAIFAAVKSNALSNSMYDFSVTAVQIIVSVHLLRFITCPGDDKKESLWQIFVLVQLAALGIALKLSSLVYGALTISVGIAVLVSRYRHDAPYRFRAAAVVGITLAATLVPWAVRGVLLSGYLLYPSTSISFPVDWKVPEEELRAEWEHFVWFVRVAPTGDEPVTALENWVWVKPWFVRTNDVFVLPLAFAAVMVGILLKERTRGRRAAGIPWMFFVPASGAVLAWLPTPDPRFVGAGPWIIGAGAIASYLPYVMSSARPGILGLAIAAAVAQNGSSIPSIFRPPRPGPAGGLYPTPTPHVTPFTTDSGLRVYVAHGVPFHAPLLTTTTPDRRLRLRCPTDVGCGFTKLELRRTDYGRPIDTPDG
jgi:hypothetical protein